MNYQRLWEEGNGLKGGGGGGVVEETESEMEERGEMKGISTNSDLKGVK